MITIVYAKPGGGKTAYLTANTEPYLKGRLGYELQKKSNEQIENLNLQGGNFSYVPVPPVYTSFDIYTSIGYKKERHALWIDGFRLGFENEKVPVVLVAPSSKIRICEGQVYFDSNKILPWWVTAFMEQHRHWDLDIMIDTQRPMRIHKSIRELARFVEIRGMVHYYNKRGKLVATKFFTREFEDNFAWESYMNTGKVTYSENEFVYNGNVFSHYQSTSQSKLFIPTSDFTYMPHLQWDDLNTNLQFGKIQYSQQAPEGYWQKRG